MLTEGSRIRYETGSQARGVGGGGEEGTGAEWEIGGLSLSGCLCCRQARMPGCQMPGCQEGRRWKVGAAGWGVGWGEGPGGQLGNGRLEGPEGEGLGRAGGTNARNDRESGPGPGRGRASSVPLVAHFDARQTNQPAPHQLDSSTPVLLDSPTVLDACGLSVCPCQSVALSVTVAVHPQAVPGVCRGGQEGRSTPSPGRIAPGHQGKTNRRPEPQGCLLSPGRARSRLAAFCRFTGMMTTTLPCG